MYPATIGHAVPGRIRLRLSGAWNPTADTAVQQIRRLPEVQRVDVNPVTGSILVVTREEEPRLKQRDLSATLLACFDAPVPSVACAPSELTPPCRVPARRGLRTPCLDTSSAGRFAAYDFASNLQAAAAMAEGRPQHPVTLLAASAAPSADAPRRTDELRAASDTQWPRKPAALKSSPGAEALRSRRPTRPRPPRTSYRPPPRKVEPSLSSASRGEPGHQGRAEGWMARLLRLVRWLVREHRQELLLTGLAVIGLPIELWFVRMTVRYLEPIWRLGNVTNLRLNLRGTSGR